MIRQTPVYFMLFFMLLFLQIQGQTIPFSQYRLVSNSFTNSNFQAINKKIVQSYPSYLLQSSVSSIYIYSSQFVTSYIITYKTRSGSVFRATANYSPDTRRLNIQSFGPVSQIDSTSTIVISPSQTIINNNPGIGITKTRFPPNFQTDYLIKSGNPSIINTQLPIYESFSFSSYSNRSNNYQQNQEPTLNTNYIRRRYLD